MLHRRDLNGVQSRHMPRATNFDFHGTHGLFILLTTVAFLSYGLYGSANSRRD